MRSVIEIHKLQRAAIVENVLRLEITVHVSLRVESGNRVENLLEGTVDCVLTGECTKVSLQRLAIHPRHDQVSVPPSSEVIDHGENVGVVTELLLHASTIENQVAGIASPTFDGHVLRGLCTVLSGRHKLAFEYCSIES